jgi:hypothetical protein
LGRPRRFPGGVGVKRKGREEGPRRARPHGPAWPCGHAAHARGARDALVVSLLATTLARGGRKEKAGSGQGLTDGRSGRRRSSGGWWRVEAVQRRARWASSSSAALSRDTVFLAAPYSRAATAAAPADLEEAEVHEQCNGECTRQSSSLTSSRSRSSRCRRGQFLSVSQTDIRRRRPRVDLGGAQMLVRRIRRHQQIWNR